MAVKLLRGKQKLRGNEKLKAGPMMRGERGVMGDRGKDGLDAGGNGEETEPVVTIRGSWGRDERSPGGGDSSRRENEWMSVEPLSMGPHGAWTGGTGNHWCSARKRAGDNIDWILSASMGTFMK